MACLFLHDSSFVWYVNDMAASRWSIRYTHREHTTNMYLIRISIWWLVELDAPDHVHVVAPLKHSNSARSVGHSDVFF